MNETSKTKVQKISTSWKVAVALAFAVIWTGGMFWWSGDYTIVNFVILSICGLLVAVAWTWVMQRFGYMG